MSLKEFTSHLNKKERVEGELIMTFVYSLLTSLVILGIFYFFRFRNIENFLSNQGYFLFFAVISYALLVPVIRQVRAYKQLACMSGMMVGMTLGMMSGFLGGFYVASTNGMFYGSLFGAIVGIVFGTWAGSCCGIMGFMEGIMAGFMGGLMGAMTAFMLLNDHLKLAALLVFIVCAVIIASLNYLIFLEAKEIERQKKEDQFITLMITFVLTLITTWLIVYGPRSPIFG